MFDSLQVRTEAMDTSFDPAEVRLKKGETEIIWPLF